jgi:hypothetical protein
MRRQFPGIDFAPTFGHEIFNFSIDLNLRVCSRCAKAAHSRHAAGLEAAVNREVIFRLESKRKHVEITLAHLREQQIEVDSNTQWKDLLARRRRCVLLAELLGWYNSKLRRVDQVLSRAVARRRTGRVAPMRSATSRRNLPKT